MLVRGHRGSAALASAGATLVSVLAVVVALGVVPSAVRAETMVRYNHPVFHNGRRVLFHGAWRGHSGERARKKSDDDNSDDEEDDPAPKGALSSPHEFIVLVDTDDATSLRMATELVNAAKAAGLKARAWAGKTSPAALGRFVDQDGGDFAVAAIDLIAGDPKAADLRVKAPLAARLANEPLVVIAAAAVDDVKQLDGRPVSFGEADGVVDTTGQALFAKLGLAPKVVHENVATSLGLLAAGKIDALVMFGSDESRSVNDAAKSGKLHALGLPWRDDLAGRYAPAVVTDKDLPKLAPADRPLATVAVPFGLVALDAADGSARATQDAPFVAALFGRNQPLLGSAADPKWREVNLSADTDWPRLAPARDWLDKHKTAAADPALDSFREAARGATDATTPEIADKLYQGLMRTGGSQP